jgi:hypothetical protein
MGISSVNTMPAETVVPFTKPDGLGTMPTLSSAVVFIIAAVEIVVMRCLDKWKNF